MDTTSPETDVYAALNNINLQHCRRLGVKCLFAYQPHKYDVRTDDGSESEDGKSNGFRNIVFSDSTRFDADEIHETHGHNEVALLCSPSAHRSGQSDVYVDGESEDEEDGNNESQDMDISDCSETSADETGESSEYHENTSDPEDAREPLTDEQMKQETLRAIAIEMMNGSGNRWGVNKRDDRKRKTKEIAAPEDFECSFVGCDQFFKTKAMLNRHIHSHYPEAYFCPVCRSVLSRPDAFLRHFKGDAKCADTNKGRYFGLPPPPNQKQFFNVYSLGLMEQYPMPGEHFRIIAGRHRGEPLVLSALFPTTTSSAGFIVTL